MSALRYHPDRSDGVGATRDVVVPALPKIKNMKVGITNLYN
jgi:hypothetical protein